MKTYLLEGFDTDPLIREVPDQQREADELLIRVHAASLNPHDDHVRTGAAKAYVNYTFPMKLGTDFAGEVLEVPSNSSAFAPGDLVFGMHDGSLSELIAIPVDGALAKVPTQIGSVEAAALGLSGATALSIVEAVQPSDGERILVHGGTGGIGTFLAQFARTAGWQMFATALDAAKADAIVRLGASEGVVADSAGLAEAVRKLLPQGADALIDLVNFSPEAHVALAHDVLRQGGRTASTLNASDQNELGDIQGTDIFGARDASHVRELARRVVEDNLRPQVAQTIDFDQIEQAFDALKSGPVGKVVVLLA